MSTTPATTTATTTATTAATTAATTTQTTAHDPAARTSSPLLRVRGLCVDYPGRGGSFRAVHDVSFDVARGRSLAVVGESGSGKSTIAKAVVRLLEPSAGTVEVDDVDIAHLSERALRPYRSRVQMVFQDPYGSLDPHLTAAEVVAVPLRLRGVRGRGEQRRRAVELLDQVGLPASAADRRPAEFSGGQRQRIGIARALASSPEVLVCDEATSALDVSVQGQIIELLLRLQVEKGLSYIVITHNLGVVRQIAEDVVVLSRGKVVEAGPTEHVLAHPADPYTRRLRAAALDPSTITGRKPRALLAPA